MNALKLSPFGISAIEGKTFLGYAGRSTWNGWACPYFTRDVAESVLRASEDRGYSWSYNSHFDRFEVRHTDDLGDVLELYNGQNIHTADGFVHVYAIGAWSWCWEYSGDSHTD